MFDATHGRRGGPHRILAGGLCARWNIDYGHLTYNGPTPVTVVDPSLAQWFVLVRRGSDNERLIEKAQPDYTPPVVVPEDSRLTALVRCTPQLSASSCLQMTTAR